ncbi:phosphatidylinositol/phosphatidylcholine transfer protein SFH9-like isoform X2 [Musa acuminata AAA Group]|uniref:phosphatidylinositol/phosphatidylcholine transfer protein SFH9-like isoform X2 n=1 Tax=Musa acuminata AAA Group TaxID=214697 RepID=UPI0031D1DCFB
MGIASQDAIMQLSALVDEVDEPLKVTFKNIHLGYPSETLVRFLKAREWSIPKAHKMLVDCLNWRIQNHIDIILNKPIIPADLYRKIRDSQLVGMSGYTKDGHPVFAIGVGLSTYDKASVNYYVQSHIQINEYRDRVILPAASKKYGRHIGTCVKVLDMTGLKLSALNQLKVVKPLLQERTRRKVQVLQGCGRDELLKIVDSASLPHFCKREGCGSSRHSTSRSDDCFSLDHPFHQQLYNYIKQKGQEYVALLKQGSFHVDVPEPDPEGIKIVETIESEMHKIGDRNGLNHSLSDLKIDSA